MAVGGIGTLPISCGSRREQMMSSDECDTNGQVDGDQWGAVKKLELDVKSAGMAIGVRK